jgi:hypothetical protein
MVSQPRQAMVCSGAQGPEASSRVAQFETESAKRKEARRPRQQIAVATGLPAQRFAMAPKPAWAPTADNADDENSDVASSRLRIVKDQP